MFKFLQVLQFFSNLEQFINLFCRIILEELNQVIHIVQQFRNHVQGYNNVVQGLFGFFVELY